MSTQVVMQGTLKPDGTLELDEKVPLPAGRMQVIILPWPELPKDDPFWQMLQRIWDGQKARGNTPRSSAEVEAERQAFREKMEEEVLEAMRLQEENRRLNVQDRHEDQGNGRSFPRES